MICAPFTSRNISRDIKKLLYLGLFNALLIAACITLPLLYAWTGHALFAFLTVVAPIGLFIVLPIAIFAAACALGLLMPLLGAFFPNIGGGAGWQHFLYALVGLVLILPLASVILLPAPGWVAYAALKGILMGGASLGSGPFCHHNSECIHIDNCNYPNHDCLQKSIAHYHAS